MSSSLDAVPMNVACSGRDIGGGLLGHSRVTRPCDGDDVSAPRVCHRRDAAHGAVIARLPRARAAAQRCPGLSGTRRFAQAAWACGTLTAGRSEVLTDGAPRRSCRCPPHPEPSARTWAAFDAMDGTLTVGRHPSVRARSEAAATVRSRHPPEATWWVAHPANPDATFGCPF